MIGLILEFLKEHFRKVQGAKQDDHLTPAIMAIVISPVNVCLPFGKSDTASHTMVLANGLQKEQVQLGNSDSIQFADCRLAL